MKRGALCILAAIALCLGLFGCGAQPGETTTAEITSAPTTTAITTTAAPEPQPWYEAIKEHVFGCQTDAQGNMYYSDGEKIWRYDMNADEAEYITEGRVFTIDGKYLYAVAEPGVVARVPLDDPEKKEVLVTAQQLGIDDEYEDFQDSLRRIEVHKNILVMQWHASLLIAYDLNKERAYRLTTGVGYEGFAVTNDYIYFSEWREFRFYRVPLKSLGRKPELIIGSEEGWWNNDDVNLYDGITVANGQLYFAQRAPQKIWRFDENGNHKLIYDFTGSGSGAGILFAVDNKIYFDWSSGVSASLERILYCYDPKTGKTKIACDDDEFSRTHGDQIRILRDRVFFVKYTSEIHSYSYGYEILSAALK